MNYFPVMCNKQLASNAARFNKFNQLCNINKQHFSFYMSFDTVNLLILVRYILVGNIRFLIKRTLALA